MALMKANDPASGANSTSNFSEVTLIRYSFTMMLLVELILEFLQSISPGTLNLESSFKPLAVTSKTDSLALRLLNN
uniref:Uncharacterized protein n=1 Tax=Arundo donax TaxID=35708 RepID=A0A0A9GM46_ARUDO